MYLGILSSRIKLINRFIVSLCNPYILKRSVLTIFSNQIALLKFFEFISVILYIFQKKDAAISNSKSYDENKNCDNKHIDFIYVSSIGSAGSSK